MLDFARMSWNIDFESKQYKVKQKKIDEDRKTLKK